MEQNKALNWDDEITKDSTFTLLPDGDYDFKVVNFERAWYEGSDKIPPCNKAVITIRVESPTGEEAELKENLFLTTKTEGLLSAFFTAIGQKKKGEPLRMNWNKVIGSTGKAKIGQRTYNDSVFNTVKRWLSPEDSKPSTGGFQPGAF